MTKQDRIAQLLAQGMQPNLIAGVVGVTPAYISQLKNNEEFKLYVLELVQELGEAEEADHTTQERVYYKDKLAAGEHKALDQILVSLQYMSGREMIQALDTIGKRRDAMEQQELRAKGIGNFLHDAASTTVNVVNLTLPTICVPELVMGPNREILSIGERSIAPMNATKLNDLLATVTHPKVGETYDEHEHSA